MSWSDVKKIEEKFWYFQIPLKNEWKTENAVAFSLVKPATAQTKAENNLKLCYLPNAPKILDLDSPEASGSLFDIMISDMKKSPMDGRALRNKSSLLKELRRTTLSNSQSALRKNNERHFLMQQAVYIATGENIAENDKSLEQVFVDVMKQFDDSNYAEFLLSLQKSFLKEHTDP